MPDVFPRLKKEKLKLLTKGVDLEKSFRDWMITIVGKEKAESLLFPSRQDKAANMVERVAITREEKAQKRIEKARGPRDERTNSDLFKAFDKRIGRR